MTLSAENTFRVRVRTCEGVAHLLRGETPLARADFAAGLLVAPADALLQAGARLCDAPRAAPAELAELAIQSGIGNAGPFLTRRAQEAVRRNAPDADEWLAAAWNADPLNGLLDRATEGDASGALRAARRIAGTDIASVMKIVVLLLIAGRFKAALSLAKGAVDERTYEVVRAKCLMMQGLPADATAVLTQAIGNGTHNDPTEGVLRAYLAQAHLLAGDPARAYVATDRNVPASKHLLTWRAMAELACGRLDAARMTLEKATVAAHPALLSDLFVAHGLVCDADGKTQAAQAYYQRGAAAEPSAWGVLVDGSVSTPIRPNPNRQHHLDLHGAVLKGFRAAAGNRHGA